MRGLSPERRSMTKTLLLFSCLFVAVAQGAGLPSRMDRSKLQIGTYCLASYARTEAHVKRVKDCGIDFIYGISAADRATLDLCAKHGLGVIATGAVPFWHGMDGSQRGQMRMRRPMADYVRDMGRFVDHPAIWMLDYVDEPAALDFDYIGEVTRCLQKLSPEGVVPYINLYPNYASAVGNSGAQANNQLGTRTYAEHVAAYMQNVPLDYACFDFYLYSARGERERAEKLEMFYDNFSVLANACRAYGKSLWYIPQVNSSYGELWLSENMLRFQAYLGLAYGVEQIDWACWSREPSDETPDMPGLTGWWTNNVLTLSGEVTCQYEKLKRVNGELRTLGERYMRYRNTMTRRVGDFVIGDMVARDGSSARAMFVLAAADPFDEHPSVQRFEFSATTARAFGGRGEIAVEKSGEGRWAIRLDTNAGALVEGNF